MSVQIVKFYCVYYYEIQNLGTCVVKIYKTTVIIITSYEKKYKYFYFPILNTNLK